MRRCCFTRHCGVSIDDLQEGDLDEFPFEFVEPNNAYIRRAVWQYEVTPTTNMLHVQGYVELTQPRTFAWIKAHIVGDQAHIEKARGSAKQNFAYCTKDETRYEGTQPTKVGDWEDMAGFLINLRLYRLMLRIK